MTRNLWRPRTSTSWALNAMPEEKAGLAASTTAPDLGMERPAPAPERRPGPVGRRLGTGVVGQQGLGFLPKSGRCKRAFAYVLLGQVRKKTSTALRSGLLLSSETSVASPSRIDSRMPRMCPARPGWNHEITDIHDLRLSLGRPLRQLGLSSEQHQERGLISCSTWGPAPARRRSQSSTARTARAA